MSTTPRSCTIAILIGGLVAACHVGEPVDTRVDGATETRFDDATAVTTSSAAGLHTELTAVDGALLATMDVGPSGATWLQAGGAPQRLVVIEVPEPVTRDALRPPQDLANGTSVAWLPTDAAEANQFLYELDRAHAQMSSLPAPDDDDVAYGDCTYYDWGEMVCIFCTSGIGDCSPCAEYCCMGPGVPGGFYCQGDCSFPPGSTCA